MDVVDPNRDRLRELPEGVSFIPTQGKMNCNLLQKAAIILYNKKKISFAKYWKYVSDAFEMEIKRRFGTDVFDYAIQFSGYDERQILLFSKFKCKNIIYSHSNMLEEVKRRGNIAKAVLEYAYTTYDAVAAVSDGIRDSVEKISGSAKNVYVTRNVIDLHHVEDKGKMDILFDDNTVSNVPLDKVCDIVNGNNRIFVNVGRYSVEKGQGRLIKAFNEIWKDNKDSYLVIIGGRDLAGKRAELLAMSETLECKDNVILILSMSNPFPLIKACDYFVLSSHYEGFGLVLAEANILGLPVISTDIPGPRTFMEANGGYLVENSEAGLVDGMNKLLNNEISVMNVDYEQYNREAFEEFKALLK